MTSNSPQSRRAVFFLGAGVLCLAAGGLLNAQTERGDYIQSNLGSLAQAAPHRPSADAKYGKVRYPLYPPNLPTGEGKDLVESYCNACHSTRYITMQPPLTRDQWTAEVTKMVKVYGIEIPDNDQPKIVQYLQDHYSAETRKK
jgi:cytochrome c5